MDHQEVREIVGRVLDLPSGHGDLDPLSEAGLDSLGSVRVLAAIQERLGFRIRGDLVTSSAFLSIDSIARLTREAADVR